MRGRRYFHPVMYRGWHGPRRLGWGWIWLFSPLLLLSFLFWPIGIILIIGLIIYYFTRKDERKEEKSTAIVYAPLPSTPLPPSADPTTQIGITNSSDIKYCPNCGSRLESSYAYCPFCGYKLPS